MDSPRPVFGISTSLTGQRWAWRGGLPPGNGLDGRGDDELLHHLFRTRGGEPPDFARLKAPTLRDWLPDPSIFADMDRAAERLAEALARDEMIVVYGDYDVDGATSAAVLIRYLRSCGGKVGHYIPDRLLEGYGPSAEALVALKQAGADLVVTVDCGTQGFAALEAARAAGLDVIVVDHHKASTALPPAVALVNPNRLDEAADAAQFGHLAAVGMAFLLAVALNRLLRAKGWFVHRDEPNLMALIDLVALGTVADVAALRGLNRAFVTQGLKVMARRENIGMAALADAARLNRAPVARDLGFALGPRVNAGGRVGQADLGVRLLTTHDAAEAAEIAARLGQLNQERRAIEQAVTDAALATATPAPGCTLVAGQGWHPGVIGIVASRLKERLGRPAIVIAIQEDGTAKGSGRSITGVDLGAAVLAAADHGLLIAGGGHAMAAGLTVAADRIGALDEFLNDRMAAAVAAATAERSLSIDVAVAPRGLNAGLVDVLETAGPYGQGWPAPRVAAGPFQIVDSRIVGDNHLRLQLAGADGGRIKAMAWRQGDSEMGALLQGARGRPIHVAGRVKRDDWTGGNAVELELDDAAFADGR
ncbi:single-stranded-DNA-specific exonuclease RecJ [Sandarakinorhabdus cyanobacteriorum]|uniref:Single-stranded-DNA-specific exonuclease RecJ n=1 Tax=Sandarakinorhabdus cyanobacteriorum TaxID=1981098 RepID=A0A255Y544_9SPHN|nr:single-stranded-DNA-specific exonuclease RecJ [Sandarakinorhabdus cyanobacteriorum]OYQ24273.1 single-stranded-DNA-specific exonuclease RecJ [Sandarakinorhabdus cyanobacteriorum]